MNFDLSNEQALYRDTISNFLADRCSVQKRTLYLGQQCGYDLSNWTGLAELGVLALPFSTDLGGLGGTAKEVAIIQEEIGYHLALEPFAQNVAIPAVALNWFDDRNLARSLAGGMISGRRTVAVAITGDGENQYCDTARFRASSNEEGLILVGTKSFVTYPSADLFLVSAAPEDEGGQLPAVLLLVPADAPGVGINNHRLIDGTPAADIEFDNVQLAAGSIVVSQNASDAIAGIYRTGAHAAVAECLGILRRMVDLTVEHTNNRIQFGKPLAANQVVRHRLAEMVMHYELAQSVVAGLGLYAVETKQAISQLSAAKVTMADAFGFIGKQSIQLHGAIGLTDEYELSHCYKRALVLLESYGNKRSHALKLAQLEAT
ncbi:hypothetical protein HJG53_14295 [Sphingomonas sp. ID1715]|uniref:acyl-CoA dehydrogenase family protein n=1 Tax=Sphingomonas sp. ID1715 TaxID=1656898 RepID=UPI001489647C|nr:acyl-CoA dehydrogenase family protein [Sphingomonas sp. ID1715]NNM78073.1 hypothetical protein [Sphingomonas sp. ID1715]